MQHPEPPIRPVRRRCFGAACGGSILKNARPKCACNPRLATRAGIQSSPNREQGCMAVGKLKEGEGRRRAAPALRSASSGTQTPPAAAARSAKTDIIPPPKRRSPSPPPSESESASFVPPRPLPPPSSSPADSPAPAPAASERGRGGRGSAAVKIGGRWTWGCGRRLAQTLTASGSRPCAAAWKAGRRGSRPRDAGWRASAGCAPAPELPPAAAAGPVLVRPARTRRGQCAQSTYAPRRAPPDRCACAAQSACRATTPRACSARRYTARRRREPGGGAARRRRRIRRNKGIRRNKVTSIRLVGRRRLA